MAVYTQEQLDALRSAVARGVREVEYDGERVRYNSVEEMLRLISVIERDLSTNRVTRTVYGSDRGFRR